MLGGVVGKVSLDLTHQNIYNLVLASRLSHTLHCNTVRLPLRCAAPMCDDQSKCTRSSVTLPNVCLSVQVHQKCNPFNSPSIDFVLEEFVFGCALKTSSAFIICENAMLSLIQHCMPRYKTLHQRMVSMWQWLIEIVSPCQWPLTLMEIGGYSASRFSKFPQTSFSLMGFLRNEKRITCCMFTLKVTDSSPFFLFCL